MIGSRCGVTSLRPLSSGATSTRLRPRFREIERLIRQRDQFRQILARVDDHRHPDARGRAQGLPVDDGGVDREGVAQAVGHQIGIVDPGVRQHDGELLAAETPDQIGLAQVRLRGPGKDLQHLVAHRVSKRSLIDLK